MSGVNEDENSSPGIDWGKFKREYVKLETDVRKRLKLTNWRQRALFDKLGLLFDVLEENSVTVDKTFSVTSKRLIRALKPIIQKAEKQKKKVISVSILRTGAGLDTSYEVKEDA
jgi:hypothetical protein